MNSPDVWHVPVSVVSVELVASGELHDALVFKARHFDRRRLDDSDVFGHLTEPFEAGERFFHVVQNAEIQDDVEDSERTDVHGGEVADNRFDLALECLLGEFKGTPAGKVRQPEIGGVLAVVRKRPSRLTFGPVLCPGVPIESPYVVVQGDDP